MTQPIAPMGNNRIGMKRSNNKILNISSREERLLHKIQAQLRDYRPPQYADEYIVSVAKEELVAIMAWAEVALQEHVLKMRQKIYEERINAKPFLFMQEETNDKQ